MTQKKGGDQRQTNFVFSFQTAQDYELFRRQMPFFTTKKCLPPDLRRAVMDEVVSVEMPSGKSCPSEFAYRVSEPVAWLMTQLYGGKALNNRLRIAYTRKGIYEF